MHIMKVVNKRILAISLAVMLFATSLCGVGVNASEPQSLGGATQELQVAVLSEPRVFPQSMIAHGPAFNQVVGSDIAMLSESQAILDAAIDEIIRQAPDVLLVPGNLTREGEVAAHEHLAGRLNDLRAALPEINIYVINGSRDINNHSARSFATGEPVLVPSATPEMFRNIYSGLGYGDETSVYFTPASGHEGANSYAARPAPGFTVIAIDTATGAIGLELLGWITEQAQAAQSRGDTVIAFMHHSLVPHSSIQSTLFSNTIIDEYESLGATLAGLGIRYVFTSAMRANNIAQFTVDGNTLTDISTASLTAYPSPIRFANFTRGVNAENRMTETVEISTQLIQSIHYIDPSTGQNINNLTEYGSRMVTPDVVVSLILDSGLYDMLHDALDEMEATEFVNNRGVRHTGLRAFIESALPVEDEYGNPLSNCIGDVFIDVLREVLPTTEAEGMDLGGIGILWYEIPQNRIRVRLLGGFAGNVFMTDANIRNHLVNPAFTQLNNNLIVDRTIVNEVIDQLGHDLLNMNVYPLPVPDGEGGYTSAGDQHTLFDLVRHAYLSHLAGDEQPEQWMLDVIEHMNDGGPLVGAMVDLVLMNLGVALDNVLHTVIINTGALVTSDLLGTAGRLAVVAFLGNNLGSIMSGFGFSAVEMVGELGDILSEEELGEFATMLTDTFLGLLVNYGYPNDNFTTLHWIGGEVIIIVPVDRAALRALIAEANQLNQVDYTPETWAVFAAALSGAEGVYNDVDATQTEVDEAVSNLQVAMDNLEEAVIIIPVDRAALRALIAEGNQLNQVDYTPETWAVFAAALSGAEGVYNDVDATQAEVDAAVSNLQVAMDNLEEAVIIIPVDRVALRALIAEANQLNQVDYTPETWAVFAAALSGAEGVYNDVDATQAEVDAAVSNLQVAMDNLEEAVIIIPVDRGALRALIAEANQLNQVDYTPETWAILEGALIAAEGVYNDVDATQAGVNAAVINLQNAIDNLEEVVIIVPVDRAALRALIAEANQLNQADYTPGSWAVFATARSGAQAVYNDSDATQVQVDNAWQSLNTAMTGLVLNQNQPPEPPPGFTVISTENQLRAMTRRGHYWLANDIELTRRWTPIARFSGTLDGNGNVIRNLEVSGSLDQGMFRRLESGATIRNLEIQVGPAGVRGTTRVGVLAGRADRAYISGIRIQIGHNGVVGNRDVGGLIGRASRSVIMGSLVYGQNGPAEVYLYHPEPDSVIAVRGNNRTRSNVGGLVGELDRSTVSRSASYVNVTGYAHVGGFVGSLRSSGISNSFARGYVLGRTVYLRFTHSRGERIGGFIGISQGTGSWIENVYSTGVVESNGRRRINPFVGQASSVLLVSGVSFYNRDAALRGTVSTQDMHNIRAYQGVGAIRGSVIGESRDNLMSRETFTTQGAFWNFYTLWTMGLHHGTPSYTPTFPHFITGAGLLENMNMDSEMWVERPIEISAEIEEESLADNVVRVSVTVYNNGDEGERADRLHLLNTLPAGVTLVPNSVRFVTENASGDEVRTNVARNTSGISIRGHSFNAVTGNLEVRLGDFRLHGEAMVVLEFDVTIEPTAIRTDASIITTVTAGRVSRTSPDNITTVTVESEELEVE